MQIATIVWFSVGCIAGALVGWLIANGRAQAELAGLRAKLEATGEKMQALLDVEKNLKESFAALAASALDANSQRLMALAKGELGQQRAEASSDLAAKETAIKNLMEPMQQSLANLSAYSQQLELKREGAYQAVLAEIQNIQRSHTELRKETTQLVQALRAPQARGAWGQAILEDCVKFAGMVQHVHFEVEKFVRSENGNYRPDLVVRLPNGRLIIVDAKTPLEAFLEANAPDADERVRAEKLKAHATQVRAHLNDLSKKAYSKLFKESPDFVVCFLPSEVLFSAALEQDPALIEFSANTGVLLASPTTLIALLKAVAFGWQQADIAANAQLIKATAIDAYGKLAGLYTDFIDLGRRLKSAGDSYDNMIVKTEGRGGLFSIARKLRDMGIGDKELGEGKQPQAVALAPKLLEAEDWQPSLDLAAGADDDS